MNYLFESPIFWVVITLGAYLIGVWLYEKLNRNAFLPPVLTGVFIIVCLLWISNTPYQVYRIGGDYIHVMLAPTVVMLAVLLYRHIEPIRKQWFRIALAVTIGSSVTVACAVLLSIWLINDELITITMHTKSVTTAVAVVVTEQMGGIPALASAFVIVTGLFGALLVPLCLRASNMNQPEAVGLSLGVCGHALGTSRAMELGQKEAAYSAMGMTLTGTLHAIILPLL